MYDTALYGYILKDGPCSLFKSRYSVHADKQDIFHAACLDLVKDLHPVVLSFGFTDPDPQDILDTIYIIPEYYIYRAAPGFRIPAYRYIQTIDKEERIKLLRGRFCHSFAVSMTLSVMPDMVSCDISNP